MAGFTTGIDTSGKSIADAPPLDFSQSRSTLGDVAVLANFGAGLLANKQKEEALRAKTLKQEQIAGAVLKVDKLRVNLQKQGASSIVIQKKTDDLLKSFGSVDTLSIIEEANKLNDVVDEQRKAEVAARKAEAEKNNEDAFKYTGKSYDENNPEIVTAVEKGRIADAKWAAQRQEYEKSKAMRTDKTEQASFDAKIISGDLFRQASIFMGNSVQTVKDGVRNGEMTQEQGAKQIVQIGQQGLVDFTQQLQNANKTLDPLVANALANDVQNKIQQFKTEIDTLNAVAGDEALTKLQLNKVASMEADDKTTLLADPSVRAMHSLVQLGLANADTLQTPVNPLIGELTNVSNAVAGFLKDKGPKVQDNALFTYDKATIPPTSSPIGSGGAILSMMQMVDGADVDSVEGVAGAAEINAKGQRLLGENLAQGKVKDDAIKQAHAVDTIKDVEYAATNKVKGQFKPEQVKRVISFYDNNFDTLQDADKTRAAQAISGYLNNYVGDSTSGVLVPSIQKSYAKIAPPGTKLYTIGVNTDTGGIQIVLASDKEIDKAFPTSTTQGLGDLSSPQRKKDKLRKLKLGLIQWKNQVENNAQLNSLINATAKATGHKKETVTASILQAISISGALPVDESVTVQPDSSGTTKPTAGSTGSIDKTKPKPIDEQIAEIDARSKAIDEQISSLSDEEFKAFIQIDPPTKILLGTLPDNFRAKFDKLDRKEQEAILSMTTDQIQAIASIGG